MRARRVRPRASVPAGADYPGVTGRGVRVAVIDSGVHPSHPHVGAVAAGASFDAAGASRRRHRRSAGPRHRRGGGHPRQGADAEIVPVKVFHRRAAGHRGRAGGGHRLGGRRRRARHQPQSGHRQSRPRGAAGGGARAGRRAPACGWWPPATQDGTRWLPGSLPGAVAVHAGHGPDRHEVCVAGRDGDMPGLTAPPAATRGRSRACRRSGTSRASASRWPTSPACSACTFSRRPRVWHRSEPVGAVSRRGELPDTPARLQIGAVRPWHEPCHRCQTPVCPTRRRGPRRQYVSTNRYFVCIRN